MGEPDHLFVSVPLIQKVRKESEDFGRDPVGWCDRVSPGPDRAEDLESGLLENVKLKYNAYQSQHMCRFVRSFDLSLIWGRHDPANSNLSSMM